jgi:regulator of RNase E activity RraB
MGIRAYGIASDSDTIKDSQEAREIVKTIMDYGVSQNQLYYIIHDLALNLEDRDNMKRIADLTKEMMDGTVLISTDEDTLLEA